MVDKAFIKNLVNELTIEEKAILCSGKDYWFTKEIERLNIPSIFTSDGPHGLRVQKGNSDHLGMNKSELSTCFPTAVATGSSFDKELLFEMGKAIGEEANDFGVNIVLGPGVNIKRNPLCGRNFEYFSEDPYLSGELASSFINGVQNQGVGTCIKHFAANNQEKARYVNNSIVDERALREIYLAPFEMAVKQSKPWSVMSSYNVLNGTQVTENKRLLTDILRNEWGFDGVVITDWGAVNDRVLSLKAGNELEMPYVGKENDKAIIDAVKTGNLSTEELDTCVERILELIFKSKDESKDTITYHHKLAQTIAESSAVLLKNDDEILPLKTKAKVAVIGSFALEPRYQGAGSSRINPVTLDYPLAKLKEAGFDTHYVEGYAIEEHVANPEKIEEAVKLAKQSEVAIIFAGLPPSFESEGYDRASLSMPESHNTLIQEVAKANENTIVVLMTGSPVMMPWKDDVKGILLMYLGGEAVGSAVATLLSGDKNPSGKLAETWPETLDDVSSTKYFAYDTFTTEYRESIYVGYRWFDTSNRIPAYPFGYGLSYTNFEIKNPSVSKNTFKKCDEIKVKVEVENIGKVDGAEVVQVYVRKLDSAIMRADKELKGFDKVTLTPGETKEVTISLNDRSFSYYDVKSKDWQIEEGKYEILVGTSTRDIIHSFEIDVEGIKILESVIPLSYQKLSQNSLFTVSDDDFKKLFIEFPSTERKPLPYHMNSTVSDLKYTFLGRLILKIFKKVSEGGITEDAEDHTNTMMQSGFYEFPLRAVAMSKILNLTQIQALIHLLNGKLFKAIKTLITKK